MIHGLKYLGLVVLMLIIGGQSGLALPPANDQPEEVLRTEIITEGRSPLDGQPLTAAQYAELEIALGESRFAPEIDPKLQQLIFLLKVRKLLKTLTPF